MTTQTIDIPEGFKLVVVCKVRLLKRLEDGKLFRLDGVTPYQIGVVCSS